jgi:hypothetical protein
MARNNGINPQQLSEYEQIILKDSLKELNEKVYCKLCGKEIFRNQNNGGVYASEVQYQMHTECVRAHNAEIMEQQQKAYIARMEAIKASQQAKAKEEAEKQQEEK